MASVKVYKKINPTQEQVHFRITKMEDIYAKNFPQVDEPHRHEYYTILSIKQAKGLHVIDFQEYKLAQNQIYFIAPGQVHQLKEETQSKGYVLVFSKQFLIENEISTHFLERINLFQSYSQNPLLTLEAKQQDKMQKFCMQIEELYLNEEPLRFASIAAYLKLYLIECYKYNLLQTDEEQIAHAGPCILKDFKKEVEAHFKNEHSIKFYADKLVVTPDHLSKSIKSNIGETAKEYIQKRLLTEAKRLLYFTDATNKEISYQLGFSKPSNFSAFFKKMTNTSPTQFRKQGK